MVSLFLESLNWSTKRQDRFFTKPEFFASGFLLATHREPTFPSFSCLGHRSDVRRFSLYNDLSTKPLTDLMQNVTFDIERPDCSYPEVLRSANSFLHRFSNHMIPRLRCTIFIWLDCDDILSDIWFLDLFGKLTAFKTVVLKHFGLKLGSRMNSVQGSTSKTVDEYLSMILGPGEYISEVHDSRFGPSHCLTYHPRQHVYSMKGPEITG